ncbi:glycerol-3-phosphate 1-O-acyltransferase PlsY [Caldimonas brevitalea]|uniref:Glycerol-3-phosphate acyltransferase n=1 Tax=Caldimonas brevitalea TaxID=413882 RepID=A0A0G3BVG7_9BURK|nr:glycerol-3-phosphate 1-O-acyltransferase PlsY [Caldimonas brevitalea]AKJ30530.1 glycerol-3-phosphate acyltransferase [Caldimonas brevitalea]
MQSFNIVLATLVAYLIGSLSFAVIVSRLMGLRDPRTYGSNNPGATNVLRSGNKVAALLTLLLDAVKGYLPTLWAVHYGGPLGIGEGGAALVGLAAFVGHLFPVFFRFQGGKGVATAAGVLLGLDPWLGLGTLATWVIIAVFFRYSSLASLVAAVFAPFFQLLGWGAGPVLGAVIVMSMLLVWRHAANIRKLIEGKESKIGQKAAAPAAAAASTAVHPHAKPHAKSHTRKGR